MSMSVYMCICVDVNRRVYVCMCVFLSGPSHESILHPNLAPKILTLVQGDPKVSRHLTMEVAVTRKGSSHLEGPPTLPRALQL